MKPIRRRMICLLLMLLAGGFDGSLQAQTKYRAVILGQTNFTIAQASSSSFGRQVGVAYSVPNQFMERAIFWDRSLSNAVVLHPSGFVSSLALGAFDGEQVGFGHRETGPARALLWHGSAESVVDLTPPGFTSATAAAVFGGVQVGWGLDGQSRALLWRGSPTNFVNLHPRLAGLDESYASCVSGTIQGGYVTFSNSENSPRAAMWRGTAESFVDLHPPPKSSRQPYISTRVNGVSCKSLVGTGIVRLPNGERGPEHAMLWHGSATNYVDLNPSGFAWSRGGGVSGDTQVGHGEKLNESKWRALAWHGTAESVVDLDQFLPTTSPPFTHSVATAIDEFGNIAGYAGYIVNPGVRSFDQNTAVLWIPETGTEPAPLLKLAPWCEANGQVKLQVIGEPGRSYALERSQDLLRWTALFTTNFTTGLFYFQDADAPGLLYGFYRARSGP